MSGEAILQLVVLLIHVALAFWQLKMLAMSFPDKKLPLTPKRMAKATQQAAEQRSYKDVPEQDVVIQGWRKYSVVPYYGDTSANVMLQGARYAAWKTRYLTATCSVPRTDSDYRLSVNEAAEKHLAHRECSCGIYSMRTRDALREEPQDVVALVVNYGWVIPAEHGYRAQYCRIEKLFVPHFIPGYDAFAMEQLVTKLEQRYGVPVERAEATGWWLKPEQAQDGEITYRAVARRGGPSVVLQGWTAPFDPASHTHRAIRPADAPDFTSRNP